MNNQKREYPENVDEYGNTTITTEYSWEFVQKRVYELDSENAGVCEDCIGGFQPEGWIENSHTKWNRNKYTYIDDSDYAQSNS